MDNSERVELIRRGNELFNEGNVYQAMKIFVKSRYRDGILRAADVIYYDKKQPLVALQFYKMIKRQDRVEEILGRMVFAFSRFIKDDEVDDPGGGVDHGESEEIDIEIHPKLKILAEEIIRDNENQEK